MSGTLVVDNDGNAIFVADGAECENCGEVLSPTDAVETEDMVMLCSKCAALDSPQV